jgi:hypothetical protein
MGATPHRLAKAASLLNLLGLSPATIKSVAALSVPTPGNETNSRAACATSRSRCSSSSAISREDLVATGHQTECEPGGRLYVFGIVAGAEVRGH